MSETAQRLRGVDLTRVDRKCLTKVVKTMKLPCDTSVESMVAALADHLIKLHKTEPEKLLECDYCHGSSDKTFTVCPYCGKSDTDAATAEAPVPAEPEKRLVNVGGKAPKPAVEKVTDSVPTADKPKRGKKAAEAPAPVAPVALAVVHSAEIVSSKELDDVVTEIKQIQVNIVENHWLLGQKLGATWELYKLRTDEKNLPKYKNWPQFVQEELDLTPRYAFDLVAVSRAFTQADIQQVGVTKLRVIARIPDEAKKQTLLEKAKQEVNGKPVVSRVEIEKEARQDGLLPGRRTLDGRQVTEESVAKRAEKATARAAAKGITVVLQPGRITLPLFATAKSKSKPKRAVDLADQPQAVEDLLNGVKVRYLIQKEDDGLVLVIERIRE